VWAGFWFLGDGEFFGLDGEILGVDGEFFEADGEISGSMVKFWGWMGNF